MAANGLRLGLLLSASMRLLTPPPGADLTVSRTPIWTRRRTDCLSSCPSPRPTNALHPRTTSLPDLLWSRDVYDAWLATDYWFREVVSAVGRSVQRDGAAGSAQRRTTNHEPRTSITRPSRRDREEWVGCLAVACLGPLSGLACPTICFSRCRAFEREWQAVEDGRFLPPRS
jgi:hypothetical protein